MQLKDDQLAKLQAQVGAEGQASALDDNIAGEPAVAAEPQATEGSAQEQASIDGGARTDSAVGNQQEPAPVAAPAPVEQPAASKPAAKPASPAKPTPVVEPESKSLIDDLLSNTLLLGVVGGSALLLLLLGLMALSRRNAMKEAELQESLMADDTVDDLRVGSPAYVDIGQESQPEPTSFHGEAAPASDELTATTGDALAEADIYIAYGRFNQAAELLQNALNDEPQRSDLRLKLMEVYAELGNREGFAREEAELREIGGATTEVEQLKYKYPAMAAAFGGSAAVAATHLDVDSLDLDDLRLDESAAPAPGQDLDDAFDLSLDDLDIDLNEERPAAVPEGESLDFDDLTLDEPVAERDPLPAASDFSFDLDEDKAPQDAAQDDLSDFSFDLDGEKETEQASNEFSLNLDEQPAESPAAFESDELDFELAEPVGSTNNDLPEGFDISLDESEFEAQPETFAEKLSEVEADLEDLSKELEEPTAASAGNLATTDADGGADDDFDFFSDTDETTTKLDLARAYIDMGDAEGARDILDEVISEGSDVQQQEAREMLAKLA
jgi:pilus assembly protein FimV